MARVDTETTITFVPWPDIELFHNLVKHVTRARQFVSESIESAKSIEQLTITETDEDSNFPSASQIVNLISKPIVYRGKVKLHGSNGGVTLEGGEVKAQSRNQFIEKSGFGTIVFDNEKYFQSLHDPSIQQKVTIFGEYCGPGVQTGVAISDITKRIFAVFAIYIGKQLIIEPTDIEDFMTKGGTTELPPNVHILSWHTEELTLDLTPTTDDNLHTHFLAAIEEVVVKIDALDPWVKDVFEVEGPGEGLVLYPVNFMEESEDVKKYKTLETGHFSLLAFKAKGEKHRVVVTKKSAQVNPEVAKGAEEFANLMCPPPRLEQGAGEVGGYHLSKMKAFIDWVVKDVEKEGKDELEASGLEWKVVLPVVRKKASAWYALKARGILP